MAIRDPALDAYYLNPDMVKFLLIENLTMKTLLHDKGLITPEEHKACQERATVILNSKVSQQLRDWKQSQLEVIKTPSTDHSLPVDGESSS